MACITQKLSKKQKYDRKCSSQHALETVEEFMIAQIGCIDVAAVEIIKRVKLRQCANSCGDRSNRCQDMVILDF